MSNEKNRDSWNKLSEHYQKTTNISLDDVHYSPYGPGEKELGVIGSVKGLDIAELGCGGGQISIVLSKWGAKSVIAIDQSDSQLEYAKNLAKRQNADIKFIRSNMEDLSILKDESFDLVVSSHAMNYAEDLDAVFRETYRILRKNGRIVTCMGHPFSSVFWEVLENNDLSLVNNYFSKDRDKWDWEDSDNQKIASFESTSYRFEEIINKLIKSKFIIERVVEPPPYTPKQLEKLGEKVPYHDADGKNTKFIKTHQLIPFSIIISAKKLK